MTRRKKRMIPSSRGRDTLLGLVAPVPVLTQGSPIELVEIRSELPVTGARTNTTTLGEIRTVVVVTDLLQNGATPETTILHTTTIPTHLITHI